MWPKIFGSALWNAIDSVVLAFGRIVVIAVAAEEDITISSSSRLSTVPSAEVPKTAVPSGDSTSFWLLVLPSPMPEEPNPANNCMLKITMKYVPSRMTVDTTPAVPGIRSESLVSSFTDVVVSQPQ